MGEGGPMYNQIKKWEKEILCLFKFREEGPMFIQIREVGGGPMFI